MHIAYNCSYFDKIIETMMYYIIYDTLIKTSFKKIEVSLSLGKGVIFSSFHNHSILESKISSESLIVENL
jgi:hypothetical protein